MTIRSVFFLLGLLTVAATLISLRREHIRTEYSFSWLAVGALLMLLAGVPKILPAALRESGFQLETVLLISGGALISALVFEISHVVSRLRDENVMLAQRIAILEFQLKESANTLESTSEEHQAER